MVLFRESGSEASQPHYGEAREMRRSHFPPGPVKDASAKEKLYKGMLKNTGKADLRKSATSLNLKN